MNIPKAKPFIRWAGSKKKLIPKLRNYWKDEYVRYIEPFMGSACLFFDIKPQEAVLNDINSELVETYLAIKAMPNEVHQALHDLPQGKEEFYEIRALEIKEMSSIDIAARFIYLNRFCFNGLYRTNLKGTFNVPFSAYKTGALPSLENLKNCSHMLEKVEIYNKDFQSVLLDNTIKGDFVYLDPPYAVRNKKIFTQYGPDTFGVNDLQRLKDSLKVLDQRGIHFVLSYAKCDEALDFFSEWDTSTVQIQRNIAGFAKNRRKEEELLMTNIC